MKKLMKHVQCVVNLLQRVNHKLSNNNNNTNKNFLMKNIMKMKTKMILMKMMNKMKILYTTSTTSYQSPNICDSSTNPLRSE
eukprot:UN09571